MSVLRSLEQVLTPGTGMICFRDRARYDKTMLRSKRRIGDSTYARDDGTLAHYFTTEEVQKSCDTYHLPLTLTFCALFFCFCFVVVFLLEKITALATAAGLELVAPAEYCTVCSRFSCRYTIHMHTFFYVVYSASLPAFSLVSIASFGVRPILYSSYVTIFCTYT